MCARQKIEKKTHDFVIFSCFYYSCQYCWTPPEILPGECLLMVLNLLNQKHKYFDAFRNVNLYIGNTLNHLELSWTILKYIELYWTILNYLEIYWTILNHLELSWTILKYIEVSWTILNYIELSWTILNYLELYWTILNYLEFNLHK